MIILKCIEKEQQSVKLRSLNRVSMLNNNSNLMQMMVYDWKNFVMFPA